LPTWHAGELFAAMQLIHPRIFVLNCWKALFCGLCPL